MQCETCASILQKDIIIFICKKCNLSKTERELQRREDQLKSLFRTASGFLQINTIDIAKSNFEQLLVQCQKYLINGHELVKETHEALIHVIIFVFK